MKSRLTGIALLSALFSCAAQAQSFTGDSTPVFGALTTTGQIGIRIGVNTFQTIGILDPTTHTWQSPLRPPTLTSLGGVFALAPVANRFVTSLGTDGTLSTAQPTFGDLGGVLLPSQVPAFGGAFVCAGLYCALSAPTTSILGGVLAKMAAAGQYMTGIDTTGTPTFAALPSPPPVRPPGVGL